MNIRVPSLTKKEGLGAGRESSFSHQCRENVSPVPPSTRTEYDCDQLSQQEKVQSPYSSVLESCFPLWPHSIKKTLLIHRDVQGAMGTLDPWM